MIMEYDLDEEDGERVWWKCTSQTKPFRLRRNRRRRLKSSSTTRKKEKEKEEGEERTREGVQLIFCTKVGLLGEQQRRRVSL
jgi:hypothetical protein